MPNWCYSEMVIGGPAEIITEIRTRLQKAVKPYSGYESIFYYLLDDPPERERLLLEIQDASDFWEYKEEHYKQVLKNPNAKTSFHSFSLCFNPEEENTELAISFTFKSAWSPPKCFYKYLMFRWPQVSFVNIFDEEMKEFVGIDIFDAEHNEMSITERYECLDDDEFSERTGYLSDKFYFLTNKLIKGEKLCLNMKKPLSKP